MTYSELKTRKKLREKEEQKKKKEEEKASKQPATSKAKPAEEILDPTQFTNNRKQQVQKIREEGKNPYPHKFDRTHRIDEFHNAFDGVITDNGVFLEDQNVAITGRIMSIRDQGAKLFFIDLHGDDKKV